MHFVSFATMGSVLLSVDYDLLFHTPTYLAAWIRCAEDFVGVSGVLNGWAGKAYSFRSSSAKSAATSSTLFVTVPLCFNANLSRSLRVRLDEDLPIAQTTPIWAFHLNSHSITQLWMTVPHQTTTAFISCKSSALRAAQHK